MPRLFFVPVASGHRPIPSEAAARQCLVNTPRLPFLTDDEIRELCAPLTQPSAQLRYLRGLGLLVQQKPNGRPLLAVSEFERVLGAARLAPAAAPGGNGLNWDPARQPNREALMARLAQRKRPPKKP